MKLYHVTEKERAEAILQNGFRLPSCPGELGLGVYTCDEENLDHLGCYAAGKKDPVYLALEVDLLPEEIEPATYGDFDEAPYRSSRPAATSGSEVVIFDLDRIRSVKRQEVI